MPSLLLYRGATCRSWRRTGLYCNSTICNRRRTSKQARRDGGPRHIYSVPSYFSAIRILTDAPARRCCRPPPALSSQFHPAPYSFTVCNSPFPLAVDGRLVSSALPLLLHPTTTSTPISLHGRLFVHQLFSCSSPQSRVFPSSEPRTPLPRRFSVPPHACPSSAAILYVRRFPHRYLHLHIRTYINTAVNFYIQHSTSPSLHFWSFRSSQPFEVREVELGFSFRFLSSFSPASS